MAENELWRLEWSPGQNALHFEPAHLPRLRLAGWKIMAEGEPEELLAYLEARERFKELSERACLGLVNYSTMRAAWFTAYQSLWLLRSRTPKREASWSVPIEWRDQVRPQTLLEGMVNRAYPA